MEGGRSRIVYALIRVVRAFGGSAPLQHQYYPNLTTRRRCAAASPKDVFVWLDAEVHRISVKEKFLVTGNPKAPPSSLAGGNLELCEIPGWKQER